MPLCNQWPLLPLRAREARLRWGAGAVGQPSHPLLLCGWLEHVAQLSGAHNVASVCRSGVADVEAKGELI